MKKIIATTLVALTAGISVANAQTGATFSNSEIWQKLHCSVEQNGFRWVGFEDFLNCGGSNILRNQNLLELGQNLTNKNIFEQKQNFDKNSLLRAYENYNELVDNQSTYLASFFLSAYGSSVSKISSFDKEEVEKFFKDNIEKTKSKESEFVEFLKKFDNVYTQNPELSEKNKVELYMLASLYINLIYGEDKTSYFANNYNISLLKNFYSKFETKSVDDIVLVESGGIFNNTIYINSVPSYLEIIYLTALTKNGKNLENEDFDATLENAPDFIEIRDHSFDSNKKVIDFEFHDENFDLRKDIDFTKSYTFDVIFTSKKTGNKLKETYTLKFVEPKLLEKVVVPADGKIVTKYGTTQVDTKIIPAWTELSFYLKKTWLSFSVDVQTSLKETTEEQDEEISYIKYDLNFNDFYKKEYVVLNYFSN